MKQKTVGNTRLHQHTLFAPPNPITTQPPQKNQPYSFLIANEKTNPDGIIECDELRVNIFDLMEDVMTHERHPYVTDQVGDIARIAIHSLSPRGKKLLQNILEKAGPGASYAKTYTDGTLHELLQCFGAEIIHCHSLIKMLPEDKHQFYSENAEFLTKTLDDAVKDYKPLLHAPKEHPQVAIVKLSMLDPMYITRYLTSMQKQIIAQQNNAKNTSNAPAVGSPQEILARPIYPLAADHACDLALLLLDSPDTQNKAELHRLINTNSQRRRYNPASTRGSLFEFMENFTNELPGFSEEIDKSILKDKSEFYDKLLALVDGFEEVAKKHSHILHLDECNSEIINAKIEVLNCFYTIRELMLLVNMPTVKNHQWTPPSRPRAIHDNCTPPETTDAIGSPQEILARPNYPLAADHASDLALLLLKSPDTQNKAELRQLVNTLKPRRQCEPAIVSGALYDLISTFDKELPGYGDIVEHPSMNNPAELFDSLMLLVKPFMELTQKHSKILHSSDNDNEITEAKMEVITVIYKIRTFIYPLRQQLTSETKIANPRTSPPSRPKAIHDNGTPQEILARPSYPLAADHACDLALLLLESPETQNKAELRKLTIVNNQRRKYSPMNVTVTLNDLFITIYKPELQTCTTLADQMPIGEKDCFYDDILKINDECEAVAKNHLDILSSSKFNPEIINAKSETISNIYKLRVLSRNLEHLLANESGTDHKRTPPQGRPQAINDTVSPDDQEFSSSQRLIMEKVLQQITGVTTERPTGDCVIDTEEKAIDVLAHLRDIVSETDKPFIKDHVSDVAKIASQVLPYNGRKKIKGFILNNDHPEDDNSFIEGTLRYTCQLLDRLFNFAASKKNELPENQQRYYFVKLQHSLINYKSIQEHYEHLLDDTNYAKPEIVVVKIDLIKIFYDICAMTTRIDDIIAKQSNLREADAIEVGRQNRHQAYDSDPVSRRRSYYGELSFHGLENKRKCTIM